MGVKFPHYADIALLWLLQGETHMQFEYTMSNVWELPLKIYILKHHIWEIFGFRVGLAPVPALWYDSFDP